MHSLKAASCLVKEVFLVIDFSYGPDQMLHFAVSDLGLHLYLGFIQYMLFFCFFSVDNKYASQGKLGAAILGNHATSEVIIWDAPGEKMSSNMCRMHRFRSSCACTKSHLGICFPLIHHIVANDSVSGIGLAKSGYQFNIFLISP